MRGILSASVLLAACGGGGDDTSGSSGTASTTTTTSSSGSGSGSTSEASTSSGAVTTSGPGTSSLTGETSTGATSEATTGEPGPLRAFDLDEDGAPETDLALVECAQAPGSTCLDVASELVPSGQVVLADTLEACAGTVVGPRLRVIGDHSGDGIGEVSAWFCRGVPPALAVVDAAAAAVIGEARAPASQTVAWVSLPRDPQGLRHPVLAPSYGDGENPMGNWGYLCAYRPDLGGGDPSCGPGFAKAATWTGAGVFREVGGTLQDLDGDGWEDLNIIYHRAQYSVSIASLSLLQNLEYDVAAATEPASPKWFHSGRNYGTHAAAVGADSKQRLVIVGGAPLGTFTDDLCNVSRFVAVLSGAAGQPGSRALAWSRYFSFSSTIFKTYDPIYANDPMQDVARLADVVDGCIHRFSDSRTVMDGQEVLLVNYFSMDAPVDLCLDEQFQLYIPPTWTQEKADAWYGCFGKNKKSPGKWGMQVLREADGTVLTGSQTTYVWGWDKALRPGDELLYLVEYLPPVTLWDLSDVAPSALQVQALSGGLWSPRGAFPAPGRPKLATVQPEGPRGTGAYAAFVELTAADRDGDGLVEVELEDGTFVGWDEGAQAFVVKP